MTNKSNSVKAGTIVKKINLDNTLVPVKTTGTNNLNQPYAISTMSDGETNVIKLTDGTSIRIDASKNIIFNTTEQNQNFNSNDYRMSMAVKDHDELVATGISALNFTGDGVVITTEGSTVNVQISQADIVADLTPPPSVTGLKATPAITSILVETDHPTFTNGHGYQKTRLYAVAGSGNYGFEQATLVAEFDGTAYSFPTNENTTWSFWAKWVTKDGIESQSASIRVIATTGSNVQSVVSALTGQITESQLSQSLTARINSLQTATENISTDVLNVAQDLLEEARIRQAAIATEKSERQTDIESLSSTVTSWTSTLNSNTSAIQNEQTARSTAIAALAQQVSTLASSSSNNAAAIRTEQTTRTNAMTALAQQLNTLTTAVAGNIAAINDERVARIGADGSLAQQIQTMVTTATSSDLRPVYAAIQEEQRVRASANTALSSTVSTLQSSIGSNSAAIQTEATTRATQTGELYAQYTVKTDVAGLISGFGLASEAKVNETPSSAFGIRADKFWVAPPTNARTTAPTTGLYVGYTWLDTSLTPNVTKYWNGSTWTTTPQNLPFVISTGSTTINGVSVPAGVYMNTAMIADATITSAKIGTLSADKITTGTLNAARIGANTITADKIDSRGLSIKDANGNVILSAGTALSSSLVTPAAEWLNSNVTLTGLGGLSKTSSDILTGPISLNAAKAITVGTPALDGVSGHNGFYIGNTGIVGTKDGISTFALDNNGNATFAGNITANQITAGTLNVDRIAAGSITSAKIDSKNLSIKDSAGNIVFSPTTLNLSNLTITGVPTEWINNNVNVTLEQLGGLSKSAADILAGPITFSTDQALKVGTPALDGVSGHNGFYIGKSGIVGTNNGVATFVMDGLGNAEFSGNIKSASLIADKAINVGTPALDGVSGKTGFYIGRSGIVGTKDGVKTFAMDNLGNVEFSGNIKSASLTTEKAIMVGTPALDSVTGHNGVYIGVSGIVGVKNGAATFAVDASGAATFSGDIKGASMSVEKGIVVGTPALDGVTGHNGLYIGASGFVGTKDGNAKFVVATDGTARFSGQIEGASLDIGNNPAISGTVMTGAGAHISANGSFALGNSTKSIVYDGTNLKLNGRLIEDHNVSLLVKKNITNSFSADVLNNPLPSRNFITPYSGWSDNEGNDTSMLMGPVGIKWNGWKVLTINYSFTVSPPFSESNLPTGYSYKPLMQFQYNAAMAAEFTLDIVTSGLKGEAGVVDYGSSWYIGAGSGANSYYATIRNEWNNKGTSSEWWLDNSISLRPKSISICPAVITNSGMLFGNSDTGNVWYSTMSNFVNTQTLSWMYSFSNQASRHSVYPLWNNASRMYEPRTFHGTVVYDLGDDWSGLGFGAMTTSEVESLLDNGIKFVSPWDGVQTNYGGSSTSAPKNSYSRTSAYDRARSYYGLPYFASATGGFTNTNAFNTFYPNLGLGMIDLSNITFVLNMPVSSIWTLNGPDNIPHRIPGIVQDVSITMTGT